MQSWLRTCKQACHFCLYIDGLFVCLPFLSLLLQHGQFVRFLPRYLTGFSMCCIWAVSSKSRKEVAARVWLHLGCPMCSLACQQNKSECCPPLACAEWQQEGCCSFTNHLECSTSSVMLYPNILGANGGHTLPSIPTTSTCPKLLLIWGPVAEAQRLPK